MASAATTTEHNAGQNDACRRGPGDGDGVVLDAPDLPAGNRSIAWFSKWRQNLDLRCVLLEVLGAKPKHVLNAAHQSLSSVLIRTAHGTDPLVHARQPRRQLQRDLRMGAKSNGGMHVINTTLSCVQGVGAG